MLSAYRRTNPFCRLVTKGVDGVTKKLLSPPTPPFFNPNPSSRLFLSFKFTNFPRRQQGFRSLAIVYSFHTDAPAACAASGQQPATPARSTRTVRSGGGGGGQLLRPAGEQCPACWPPAISSSLFFCFFIRRASYVCLRVNKQEQIRRTHIFSVRIRAVY